MAIKDFIIRGDLQIKDGDLLLLESEQDHINDIVIQNRGEQRQFPLIGAGALNFLNGSESLDQIRKKITLQLESDSFRVEEIIRSGDAFRITAKQSEAI
jgi:hypothetical protein